MLRNQNDLLASEEFDSFYRQSKHKVNCKVVFDPLPYSFFSSYLAMYRQGLLTRVSEGRK